MRLAIIAAVLAYLALWFGRPVQSGAVVSARLADGRIFHLEKVSYGTRHSIGQRDYINPLFPWLPSKLRRFVAPKRGEFPIVTPQPELIVWVDATDAATGKDVDCQRVRLEFVDRQGELWPAQTSACTWDFNLNGAYDRVAHGFTSFPRDEPTLTLRVRPWKSNAFTQLEFKNPCYTAPAAWKGLPLPQRQETNGLQIVLHHLTLATNGGPDAYWATPSRYWNPSWQILRNGVPAAGWDDAEWEAEDPLGNRGQTPNVRQPVLRLSATFHPSATNLEAAVLVATLPTINLASFATNLWNVTNHFQSNDIVALGSFPPGTYVFCAGQFTNGNPGLGPVRGGAPSGWVAREQKDGPNRVRKLHGHYTPFPVIYLRYKEDDSIGRFAVRLRGDQGDCWIAAPEPQKGPDEGHPQRDIHPFMMSPPVGVKSVTPEIVCLIPVKASFLVSIPAAPQTNINSPAARRR